MRSKLMLINKKLVWIMRQCNLKGHAAYFLVTFLLLCASQVNAETNSESLITYGAELDALPFLTGGYYLSGFVGEGAYRVRAVGAKVNIPEFTVKQGFEDNVLKAYALILDYFPQGRVEGVWWGGGVEYWDSSIASKGEGAVTNYENYVVTMGGGYVWRISQNVYLNPWGALHGIVAGDSSVEVGSRKFRPQPISGEVSLKIGLDLK